MYNILPDLVGSGVGTKRDRQLVFPGNIAIVGSG